MWKQAEVHGSKWKYMEINRSRQKKLDAAAAGSDQFPGISIYFHVLPNYPDKKKAPVFRGCLSTIVL